VFFTELLVGGCRRLGSPTFAKRVSSRISAGCGTIGAYTRLTLSIPTLSLFYGYLGPFRARLYVGDEFGAKL
jgi:hypothetical protein